MSHAETNRPNSVRSAELKKVTYEVRERSGEKKVTYFELM